MPIESTHPKYDATQTKWRTCRDAYEGEEAVKSEGETYLPKLHKTQDNTKYAAYKTRSQFFEFTDRAVHGLVGATIRKEPRINLPDDLKGLVTVDQIKKAVTELLLTGRFSLLPDMPAEEGGMPYLAMYRAENLINWRTDEDGAVTLAVLKETYYASSADDEYKQEENTRYRELILNQDTGKYEQRVWQTVKGKLEVVEEVTPQRAGNGLKVIPLFTVTPEGLSIDPVKPPILPLANANLRHYRLDADHIHGLHYVALPTAYVSGVPARGNDKDGKPKRPSYEIGSGTAWVLEKDGRAGFLEVTGAGFSALAEEKAATEKRMAILGARLIEGQRAGQAETAETARIRQSGESSVLTNIVGAVGLAFTEAAKFAAEWAGKKSDDILIELNKDFISTKLSAEEIRALLELLLANQISYDTFWEALQEGEWAPAGRSAQDELDKIKDQEVPLIGETMDLDEEDTQSVTQRPM